MLDEFEQSAPAGPKGRSIFVLLVSLGLFLGLAVGGYFAFRDSVQGAIDSVTARFFVPDYEGPGGPATVIIIEPGDSGEDVARKLLAADVVKSFDAVYRPMLSSDVVIFPGHYEFPTKIPGTKALEILLAGDTRVTLATTIPEGWQVSEIVPRLAADLDISEQELWAAVDAANELHPGPTLEGYLFPASYTFDPGVTASEVIGAMIARLEQEFATHGLELDQAHDILTLASIVQLEGRADEDFYKIARVFLNRIDVGMPLQSDPTVKYYYEGSLESFQEGIADTTNPFNTYQIQGLPPGAISSPGAAAIDATMNPTDGDWLYFVAINLATGETVFSNTLAEHERATELYRQWLRDNPGWDE